MGRQTPETVHAGVLLETAVLPAVLVLPDARVLPERREPPPALALSAGKLTTMQLAWWMPAMPRRELDRSSEVTPHVVEGRFYRGLLPEDDAMGIKLHQP